MNTAMQVALLASSYGAATYSISLDLKPCIPPICTDPYLDVTGIISPVDSLDKTRLLSEIIQLGPIPLQGHNSTSLQLSDLLGNVPFVLEDLADGNQRYFRATRDLEGDQLTFQYRSTARNITPTSGAGPRQELRYEPNGFNGGIKAIGPLPFLEPQTQIKADISFDMSATPEGSYGFWSLGTLDSPTHYGTFEQFTAGYYAAGQLFHYPGPESKGLKVYYFSDPEFDVVEMATTTQSILNQLTSFFHDKISPYSVLLRKNTNNVFGGSGGQRAFLLEYGDMMPPPYNQVPFLAEVLLHEIMHGWALILDDEFAHGTDYCGWYVEGIASYYQVALSSRFAIMPDDIVLQSLNELAISYSTSPFLGIPYATLLEQGQRDLEALLMIYDMGAIYFWDIGGQLYDADGLHGGLDQIVVHLAAQYAAGNQPNESTYLQLLAASALGKQATDSAHRKLMSGSLIIPGNSSTTAALVPEFKIRLTRREIFELGFDRDSLEVGETIKGLAEDSRAAETGLKNGDHVLDHSGYRDSKYDVSKKISISVERTEEQGDKRVLHFDFLPRGKGKLVESWEWYRDD